MLTPEFIKKIRQIELHTRKIVNTTFAGEYKSTFKGTGMEFVDVREYQPGDDVRSIDWKVTARMGRPYVKKFVEERELTVILCVDASGSGYFGTRGRFKVEQAAQVAATLAFSAVKNNDKVGLLFFTDRVEKYIPPKKGRLHVMRLIRDILYFAPERRGTSPSSALEFLMHILKHRAIVFFIGDFLGQGYRPQNFKTALGIASRRHDLVAVSISDPAEQSLPPAGLVDVEDAESGKIYTVNFSDKGLAKGFFSYTQNALQEKDRLFKQLSVDQIDISTTEDFTPKLHKFFKQRAKRFH